jgi:predicted RNA-binding Zn ribbon-like protein
VEFDSHIGGMVVQTVQAINALTPGESCGKPYPVPADARQLVDQLFARDLAAAGIVLSDDDVTAMQEVFAQLRVVFEAVAAGNLDRGAETLNTLMTDWKAHPHLSRHDNEPWHLHFHQRDADFVEGLAAGLATRLAHVFGSEYVERLGVCSAPACDRVYADTSRNGTRRFCSTTCQNRVKAATFRARQAGTASG